MKMNFEYFKIQKSMLQTVRVEKLDEKQGHLFSFHVPFLKCKSIKAIYMYAS